MCRRLSHDFSDSLLQYYTLIRRNINSFRSIKFFYLMTLFKDFFHCVTQLQFLFTVYSYQIDCYFTTTFETYSLEIFRGSDRLKGGPHLRLSPGLKSTPTPTKGTWSSSVLLSSVLRVEVPWLSRRLLHRLGFPGSRSVLTGLSGRCISPVQAHTCLDLVGVLRRTFLQTSLSSVTPPF